MVVPKIDDRAYNRDRFSRHDVLKSKSSCLRFPPDYGHFRRHADILKRLPCLQLIFSVSSMEAWRQFLKLNVPAIVNSMQRRIGMKMCFNIWHAYAVSFWCILIMLTDEWIYGIQHYQCWQIPWFPELNIASIYKQVDFWNSALSSLTFSLISKIQHCWIFTKSRNPWIQHCWFFAEWRFLRNYIARFLDFLHSMRLIRKSTLQTDNADFLKPVLLCKIRWFLWISTRAKEEDCNVDFGDVPGL